MIRVAHQVTVGVSTLQPVWQSGKDRTGMSVTLEEARILEQRHGLPADQLLPTANLFREHGGDHMLALLRLCATHHHACVPGLCVVGWRSRHAACDLPQEHGQTQVRVQLRASRVVAEDVPASRSHTGNRGRDRHVRGKSTRNSPFCFFKMGLNSSKPLKEQIRENKREINRAIRELERERVKLERQEEKLKGDITKAAKESQVVSAIFVPFPWPILGRFWAVFCRAWGFSCFVAWFYIRFRHVLCGVPVAFCRNSGVKLR
jgi:hypothetical protein